MKMLATAFCVLGSGMLFSTAAQGTSTAPERPQFKIEIRATGEKGQGPSFAVTNLTAKTVTLRLRTIVSVARRKENNDGLGCAGAR